MSVDRSILTGSVCCGKIRLEIGPTGVRNWRHLISLPAVLCTTPLDSMALCELKQARPMCGLVRSVVFDGFGLSTLVGQADLGGWEAGGVTGLVSHP